MVAEGILRIEYFSWRRPADAGLAYGQAVVGKAAKDLPIDAWRPG